MILPRVASHAELNLFSDMEDVDPFLARTLKQWLHIHSTKRYRYFDVLNSEFEEMGGMHLIGVTVTLGRHDQSGPAYAQLVCPVNSLVAQ